MGKKARALLLFGLTVLLLAAGASAFRGEPIVGKWVAMYPLPASPVRFYSSNSRFLPDQMEFRRDGTYVWRLGIHATPGLWRLSQERQSAHIRIYDCEESGVIVARAYRNLGNDGNVAVFVRPLWDRPASDVQPTDGLYVGGETPLARFWRRVTDWLP